MYIYLSICLRNHMGDVYILSCVAYPTSLSSSLVNSEKALELTDSVDGC